MFQLPPLGRLIPVAGRFEIDRFENGFGVQSKWMNGCDDAERNNFIHLVACAVAAIAIKVPLKRARGSERERGGGGREFDAWILLPQNENYNKNGSNHSFDDTCLCSIVHWISLSRRKNWWISNACIGIISCNSWSPWFGLFLLNHSKTSNFVCFWGPLHYNYR